MRIILPNAKAYDAAGTGHHSLFSQDHCCICGKQFSRVQVRWLLLCRAIDGSAEYAVDHPEAIKTDEWKVGGFWIAPIGSDCLAKHKDLKPFLIPWPLHTNLP